jgi:hypothetical protein
VLRLPADRLLVVTGGRSGDCARCAARRAAAHPPGRRAPQGAGTEERRWRSPATDADEPADQGAARLRPAPINGAPSGSPHRATHTCEMT